MNMKPILITLSFAAISGFTAQNVLSHPVVAERLEEARLKANFFGAMKAYDQGDMEKYQSLLALCADTPTEEAPHHAGVTGCPHATTSHKRVPKPDTRTFTF